MFKSTSTLPPTVNSLDPLQRSRLLRSARKLGDVLGTTPLIIDSTSQPSTSGSHTKRRLVSSKSFSASVTSFTECAQEPSSPRTSSISHATSSSLNKHKKHRSLARPVVLFLSSLPPIPRPPPSRSGTFTSSDENDVTNPPYPSMRERAVAMPPSQDTDALDAEKLVRRKRMAKLTRTLGENIPPELVFPHHHKSRSEPPPNSTKYNKEWGKPTAPTAVQNLSKLDSDSNPIPNSTPNPAPSPVPSDVRVHKHRSLTIGTRSSSSTPVRRPSTSDAHSRKDAPFSSVTDGPSMTSENMIRNWRGEWSIKDAEQRAMVLRNLKG